MKVFVLKKRKDFLKAAQGFKAVVNGVVLQAAFHLPAPEQKCCFVGYTATKKIGKAFLRNRSKRRLRAAVALVLPEIGIAGVDYVFICRHNTAQLDFDYLTRRLKEAVININQQICPPEISDDTKTDNRAD